MPAHIINKGIVSGGMFIAIGESIIARVAALGGYISFSLTGRPKTPYEQVLLWLVFLGMQLNAVPPCSHDEDRTKMTSHHIDDTLLIDTL